MADFFDIKTTKFYTENNKLFIEEDYGITKYINDIIEKEEFNIASNAPNKTIFWAPEAEITFSDEYITTIKKLKLNEYIKIIFNKLSEIQLYFELIKQILEENEKNKAIPTKLLSKATILSDSQFLLFFNLLKKKCCFEIAKLLDSQYQNDDDANIFVLLGLIKKLPCHVHFEIKIKDNRKNIIKSFVTKRSISKPLSINKKIGKSLHKFFIENIHEKLIKEYKHLTTKKVQFENELLESYAVFVFLSKFYMRAINRSIFFSDSQISINKKQADELFGEQKINYTNTTTCYCIQDWITNLDRVYKIGNYYDNLLSNIDDLWFIDSASQQYEFQPYIENKYKFDWLEAQKNNTIKDSIKKALLLIISDNRIKENKDACLKLIEWLADN